jgi:hypothetical protein
VQSIGVAVSKGHVVGKAAGVDLSAAVTIRISANDKYVGSSGAPHVGQRHSFVVDKRFGMGIPRI